MMTVSRPQTGLPFDGPKGPGGLPRVIITIDGPAGTGKSSVARALAARLGLDFLDTGAMYRAAAALVIEQDVDPTDMDAVCALVANADLHFDWRVDPPAIGLGASGGYRSLSERIRDADVTRLVSPLAGIGRMREHMVQKQRVIAAQHPRLVTEGRDQGSVVFPDADAKFYLDASERVRAARRADQLRKAGIEADEESLLIEIKARDQSDKTRAEGPLVCPADATVIDTSYLTFDQVVDRLEQAARAKVPPLGSGPATTGSR